MWLKHTKPPKYDLVEYTGQEVFKWRIHLNSLLTLVHIYHLYVVFALCIFYWMNLFLHVLYTGRTAST